MNRPQPGRSDPLGSPARDALRIALVTDTYPPDSNCAAMTLQRSVAYLRLRGHPVELVRPRHPCDAPNEAEDEMLLPGLRLHRDLQIGLPATRMLRKAWRAQRPDVVHIATAGPLGWSALQTARTLDIPASTEYHPPRHESWLERPLDCWLRHFHNAAACTFVPTSALRTQLSRRGYRNLAVMGCGVDSQRYNPARRSRALRRRWALRDDDLAVLHVGRFVAESGLKLAARAFEAIRRTQPTARMVWIGDGPLRAKYQQAHPDHVFLGARSGEVLAACYASADICLYPRLGERFGNIPLEAMASGLALVAFDCGAAGEHALDGMDACLVPYGDELCFIQRAVDLARFPALRHRLRHAARSAVRSLHWSAVLGEFEQQLRVIAQRDAAAAG